MRRLSKIRVTRVSMIICLITLFMGFGRANGSMTIGNGWDGPGLGQADLTWFLASQTTDITLAEQRNIIDLVIGQWATYADITFTEAASAGGNNQIDFNFGATSVETMGFNGFSYFPSDINSEPIAGDVFINDALAWTAGTTTPYDFDFVGGEFVGYDLYPLVLHEVGHSLGMLHPIGNSTNSGAAVMDPFFGTDNNGTTGFFLWDELQADDIAGIQSLYGTPGNNDVIPEPATFIVWSLLGITSTRCLRRRR